MTFREQTAFHAGVRAAIDMARTAAVTIEIRDDAREVRQQAAAAALQGLADGLRVAFLAPPSTGNDLVAVLAGIASDPAQHGERPCPDCAGRLRWMKDSTNGHVHAVCETPECVRVMQ